MDSKHWFQSWEYSPFIAFTLEGSQNVIKLAFILYPAMLHENVGFGHIPVLHSKNFTLGGIAQYSILASEQRL